MTDEQMRERLSKEVDKTGGVRAWAKRHGLNASLLSRAMLGKIPLPPAIVTALGFERVISYRKVDP